MLNDANTYSPYKYSKKHANLTAFLHRRDRAGISSIKNEKFPVKKEVLQELCIKVQIRCSKQAVMR